MAFEKKEPPTKPNQSAAPSLADRIYNRFWNWFIAPAGAFLAGVAIAHAMGAGFVGYLITGAFVTFLVIFFRLGMMDERG